MILISDDLRIVKGDHITLCSGKEGGGGQEEANVVTGMVYFFLIRYLYLRDATAQARKELSRKHTVQTFNNREN